MNFKDFLTEGHKADAIIANHSTKMTDAELEIARKAINSHDEAGEDRQWFNGSDGPEIDLNTIFKKSKSIATGGRSKEKVCLVPLSSLHRAQSSVQKNHLIRTVDKNKELKDEDLPRCVYIDRHTVIIDGHHRLTALKLAGRKYAKVKLVVARETGPMKCSYSSPRIDAEGRFVEPIPPEEKEEAKSSR